MIAKFILLGLMTLSLGISIAEHGKERKPINAFHSLISYVIYLLLFAWCGFFDNF